MVAPLRTPQARGVKCDLCKKILTTATWLDQTKLAKDASSAETVLKLIDEHIATSCPCIPKNIENLLIGSTEFEIHRLLFKSLDTRVHRKQTEFWLAQKDKVRSIKSSRVINDCYDGKKTTRFNFPPDLVDDSCNPVREHLNHLKTALDFWKIAMEDEVNPFNSKLALRLGLTHHVIYACYLFKYYRMIDYQLIASNLLLNLFRTIEGVTENAILHALFLFIRTLVDCGEMHLAQIYLKQAQKMPNYNDKSSYESILLRSIACEIELIESGGSKNSLEDLIDLVTIESNDKLQHYYARTLAMSTILRYIHLCPVKSQNCFEFYHTYRYVCAIIRRCYETSFDLILSGIDTSSQTKSENILDHNWIRFAICDFAFSTFDLLFQFNIRAGHPENIEILYNGLSLISFRSGCLYWQARIAIIGVELDTICGKIGHAKTKLDSIPSIVTKLKDLYMQKHIESEYKLGALLIACTSESQSIETEALSLINQTQANETYLLDRVCNVELFDCVKSRSRTRCDITSQQRQPIAWHKKQCLRIYSLLLKHKFRKQERDAAMNLVDKLKTQLSLSGSRVHEYYDLQTLLEIALYSTNIDRCDLDLLDTIGKSDLFLHDKNNIFDLGSQLSSLSISSKTKSVGPRKPQVGAAKSRQRLTLPRRSKRGNYEVATKLQQSLLNESDHIGYVSASDTLDNLKNLTTEEIVVSFLRNSEPNPHYLLYRKAHEMMFRIRLGESSLNHELLLYHFAESCCNTIRYRWMMYEEQQMCPYDYKSSIMNGCPATKNIGFYNTVNNIEKTTRQLTRTIGEDQKLLQFKYIFDEKQETEHLLVLVIDGPDAPIYIHTSRGLYSHNFISEATASASPSTNYLHAVSLIGKIATLEQESRTTLLMPNLNKKTDTRQRLETELGILLQEFEDEFLGAFRFITCGSFSEPNYNKFVLDVCDQIESMMGRKQCKSRSMLKMLVENAPFASRSEFCSVFETLFKCKANSDESKGAFNTWQKSIELFLADQGAVDLNKLGYCQKLNRAPVGLILDCDLVHIPFESLPLNRVVRQGIFRVPSLRIYTALVTRLNNKYDSNQVDPDRAAYLLDPANNLSKTRERFESRLRSLTQWSGLVGAEPKSDELEGWLSEKDIYLFIGHGAGTAYYNKLCNNRGLSFLSFVKAVSIVMGCSSGKLQREGPQLEPFGISWVFVLRGSPAYLGLLWDVTDTDIDKFLDSLLCLWLTHKRWSSAEEYTPRVDVTARKPQPLTDAVARARSVCKFKHLVGSTPVIYGLPVYLKFN